MWMAPCSCWGGSSVLQQSSWAVTGASFPLTPYGSPSLTPGCKLMGTDLFWVEAPTLWHSLPLELAMLVKLPFSKSGCRSTHLPRSFDNPPYHLFCSCLFQIKCIILTLCGQHAHPGWQASSAYVQSSWRPTRIPEIPKDSWLHHGYLNAASYFSRGKKHASIMSHQSKLKRKNNSDLIQYLLFTLLILDVYRFSNEKKITNHNHFLLDCPEWAHLFLHYFAFPFESGK